MPAAGPKHEDQIVLPAWAKAAKIGNQINRGSHLFFSLLTVGGGLQRVDLVWQNVAICILL